MTSIGTAFVTVKPDLSGVNRQVSAHFRKTGDQAGSDFARGFKAHPGLTNLGKVAAGGLVLGLGAFVVAAKSAVAAGTETEKVGAQTNQVLRSTGRIAGVTAKHIGDLATAISQKTGIDDEAIQSSENLLLTFTNVRNEAGKGNKVFDQAARAVTDMSVALGQDGKSSAIQLGKALNDPIKGVTALQRVGVSFTKAQKDQIKTLVTSGKTLQAQKLILGEVNKEFGGSAAAQAQPLDKLKVSVGNLQETIGLGLKPAVDSVANSLNGLAISAGPGLQKLSDDISSVFKRTDIGLGDKLKLSSQDVRRDLGPTIDSLEQQFKDAHVGDKIGQAIEIGVPKIADAAAAAAPHAAGAFVNAFKNAGPWGKLVTVAFLGQKLGAFDAAGKAAGGLMVKSLSKALGGPLSRLLRRSGEDAAANAAEGLADHIGTSVAARQPRIAAPFRTSGAGSGRAFSRALVVGAVAGLAGLGFALATEINKQITKALGLSGGLKNLGRSAAKGIVPGTDDPFGIGKKIKHLLGLNAGGLVPGVGDKDIVPTVLTPGEFVVRKSAVKKIGVPALTELNGPHVGSGLLKALDGGRGGFNLQNSPTIGSAFTAKLNTKVEPAFQKLNDPFVDPSRLRTALTLAGAPNLSPPTRHVKVDVNQTILTSDPEAAGIKAAKHAVRELTSALDATP